MGRILILLLLYVVIYAQIGIGTTTPIAKFHIKGLGHTPTNVFQVDNDIVNPLDSVFVVSPKGYVGIGVPNPLEKLHVNGNIRFDGALMPNGNPGTSGQVLVSKGTANSPQWESRWYLWKVEDWANGDTNGWSGAGGIFNCGGQTLLGGYNNCGHNCTVSKTFSNLPPHSEVMVEVYWWSIDSWEQRPSLLGNIDSLILEIDGTNVGYSYPIATGNNNNRSSMSNVSVCGNPNALDFGPHLIVGRIQHNNSTMTIKLRCGVSAPPDNESCAFQLIKIWLKP